MKKTLIYYKLEYLDLAVKLRDNYLLHGHEADIISESEQDDIAYAEKMLYDEAIFIEDLKTVIIHDNKTGYTSSCSLSDIYYV